MSIPQINVTPQRARRTRPSSAWPGRGGRAGVAVEGVVELGAGVTGAGLGVPWCECTAMAITSPAGEVIVVRVVGEVDLATYAVLRDALADSLARGPCHLVIDIAAVTFCSVRGLTLLVQTAAAAAERRTGYAVSGASAQINRIWALLWAPQELPMRFASVAVGVLAAMAHQAADDRARWAPRHGPRWIRHNSTHVGDRGDHEGGGGSGSSSTPPATPS